ncbi:hypothetical protein BU14_0438s0018 [Porphyra umbilicalis]|uniref:Uncharacterized protein n=1 Tax=Porphyra umbilicalis TaxID=2786 RepID=A0A1X6NVL9_PORUM|nr:hypothetical protein BU14_0438s0018 [Porphyra umbilicalis]|eukprot:OSX72423.1 hypothetical protein BU14_0438s0018 [Porphyra umbilicalis]
MRARCPRLTTGVADRVASSAAAARHRERRVPTRSTSRPSSAARRAGHATRNATSTADATRPRTTELRGNRVKRRRRTDARPASARAVTDAGLPKWRSTSSSSRALRRATPSGAPTCCHAVTTGASILGVASNAVSAGTRERRASS